MTQLCRVSPHPPLDYAQLYRVLAETASDAIVAIDEVGVVLSVNPAAEALFGFRSDELVGQSLTRVMPERFREQHTGGMERYLRTGERRIPWRAVGLPVLTKDGREIPAEISFGELTANGRRIFSGIIRDVSARVAAEAAALEDAAQLQEQATELEQQVDEAQRLGEELEESNQELSRLNAQLGAVVEAITDGFVALDADVRFTWVNTRAADMWGLPASALLGRTPAEVWPALDMERSSVLTLLRHVLVTRQTESVETISPTLRTWIEIRAYPAAGGGIVAFFRDISERRRARELDALLAEASELLASSTDYDETLANVARTAVPRLGDWAAVDLLDDPTAKSWPPVVRRVAIVHDDPAGLALASEFTTKYPQQWDNPGGMAAVIRDGSTMFVPELTDEMLAATAKDAEHLRLMRALQFHSVIAVPIAARGQVLGALTLVMTSSRRRYTTADLALAEDLGRRAGVALDTARLLRDAQRARAQAEEANTAKLTFLATMSHELRTPLNAIAGHVELMDMGLHGPVTDAQRDALARVSRAQGRLLGLINDILTYAKVESGRTEYSLAPVDPAPIIREVCALVEPQFIAKQLRLGMELPPAGHEPLLVLADAEKLMQVLLNLLSNALKFTPSPGSVTVTLAAAAPDARVVSFAVRDSGAGIPADKLESIFEPFVQLGRSLTTTQEGTGLGLAVSRDLARGMGGDLTVRSAEEDGSTFILTLPRAGAPAQRN